MQFRLSMVARRLSIPPRASEWPKLPVRPGSRIFGHSRGYPALHRRCKAEGILSLGILLGQLIALWQLREKVPDLKYFFLQFPRVSKTGHQNIYNLIKKGIIRSLVHRLIILIWTLWPVASGAPGPKIVLTETF